MEPQQRPTRRVNDLGPARSMDMRRRPSAPAAPQAAQPAPRPAARPVAPVPTQRPVAPAPRAVSPRPQQAAARPVARPAQPTQRSAEPISEELAPATPAKRGGTGRTILQFIVGLLVIIGVAAAIVALYIRYYQG